MGRAPRNLAAVAAIRAILWSSRPGWLQIESTPIPSDVVRVRLCLYAGPGDPENPARRQRDLADSDTRGRICVALSELADHAGAHPSFILAIVALSATTWLPLRVEGQAGAGPWTAMGPASLTSPARQQPITAALLVGICDDRGPRSFYGASGGSCLDQGSARWGKRVPLGCHLVGRAHVGAV